VGESIASHGERRAAALTSGVLPRRFGKKPHDVAAGGADVVDSRPVGPVKADERESPGVEQAPPLDEGFASADGTDQSVPGYLDHTRFVSHSVSLLGFLVCFRHSIRGPFPLALVLKPRSPPGPTSAVAGRDRTPVEALGAYTSLAWAPGWCELYGRRPWPCTEIVAAG